jgi:PAS domain S-box-containing protein
MERFEIMHGGDGDLAEFQGAVFESLLEQTQVGVGICDRDGDLVLISPTLAMALGAGYSPTPERTWADHYCLHDEQGRQLESGGDPLARAWHGERLTDELVSVRRPGEPVRWILCSGFPLRRNGEQLGAAVFVLDVTARMAEQRRLDELRDRLVDTVNHEVRTPVAKIKGHLELLEPAVPALPTEVRWSVEAINRATERLAEVVTTISDLAEQSQRPTDAGSN